MSAPSARPASVPLVAASAFMNLGGSSTFLVNLAAEFREHTLALPVVVLTDRFELRTEFAALGTEINLISTRRHIYEDRLLWGYRQLTRHQPRAVLACLGSESFELLRLVPPGVLRLGIIQSDDPAPYQTAARFAAWLDGMIGVSTHICGRLRALPEMARVPVEHIPYGIRFAPPKPRRPRAPDAPLRVVYLGRMIEVQKRISRLAALIQLLRRRGTNVEFTLIGSGSDEAAFRTAVADCPNVRCLGALPYDQVPDVLRENDVFILLSDFEGLPLSLLEAMGEGLVPVVSDLESGIREVVTESCGIRVPVGDVEAAATAIAALAEDRERLQTLSSAAARVARENYSAARMARSYLELIERRATPEPVRWPETVPINLPLGLPRPWLYQGLPRLLRRALKRWRL